MKSKSKKVKKDKWLWQVFIITFILSSIFGSISNSIVNNLNIWFSIVILFIFIIIGIMFDMLGMSVASAKEAPFHSKASKKHKGAKEALMLIKSAPKVSNICNDVIGDICGIISGSIGALIAISISATFKLDIILVSLLVSSFIASLTVGGKAISKKYAANNNVKIINFAGEVIHIFYKVKK